LHGAETVRPLSSVSSRPSRTTATAKETPTCDEAWCLHVYPVEAFTLDKLTAAKNVNESTCVGCKVCTINCVQETGEVRKCDLCVGGPACAEACPTGAITHIDANGTGLDKMAARADKLGNRQTA